MSSTKNNASVLRFFMKHRPTQALFHWLMFRVFVASTASATKITIAKSNPTTEDVLSLWQKDHAATVPHHGFYYILLSVFGVFGAAAMAGTLNYSGSTPINIWLPLAVFAFLPFLFTLVSAYGALLSSGRFELSRHPVFTWLIKKMGLDAFVPYQSLLMRWLIWQFQFLSIVFIVSALLTFFVLGTFQNFSFGWSSTFISDPATFKSLMDAVSLPWAWAVEGPSILLIESTQFKIVQNTNLAQEAWWPSLVMAIVFYGLLPRFILSLVLRVQLTSALKQNILESSEMSQLMNALNHQESLNALADEDALPQADSIDIRSERYDVISWRQSTGVLNEVKTLGQTDWASDEHWLRSTQCPRQKPVLVAVRVLQTPTGELEDCIALIRSQNDQVSLVVLAEQFESGREVGLLTSWLHFVAKQQLPIYTSRGSYDNV